MEHERENPQFDEQLTCEHAVMLDAHTEATEFGEPAPEFAFTTTHICNCASSSLL